MHANLKSQSRPYDDKQEKVHITPVQESIHQAPIQDTASDKSSHGSGSNQGERIVEYQSYKENTPSGIEENSDFHHRNQVYKEGSHKSSGSSEKNYETGLLADTKHHSRPDYNEGDEPLEETLSVSKHHDQAYQRTSTGKPIMVQPETSMSQSMQGPVDLSRLSDATTRLTEIYTMKTSTMPITELSNIVARVSLSQ